MRLAQALRLGASPQVVFVGSGGKTTALFQLARELLAGDGQRPTAGTVLVSATTHLAVQQMGLADHCYVIRVDDDLDALETEWPGGLVLCIGPEHEEERMTSLTAGQLERLRQMAQAHGCPLLLEGDGSRRRPLKAPALHEPVIPAWVDTVVVVAGMNGLGQALDAPWVHRPELFSGLSGLEVGARVTIEGLAKVLGHPDGGLKSIPDGARRVLLLNQADDAERQAGAQRLAEGLVGVYDAVLTAALAPEKGAAEGGVLAVYEKTAGVILAAGGASRLGKPKQMLAWRGEAFVRHVARAALRAGLEPVVVVTGYAAEDVKGAVSDLAVQVVDNPEWQAGQSSSLQAGLGALPERCGGAVFLLADQPQVSAELVRGLVEVHAGTLSPLVAPLVDGRRGNPVLFDRCTFDDLRALQGDVGGRALFARYPAVWLPWLDPMQGLDVDTQEDYTRLLEMGDEQDDSAMV